MNPVLGNYHSLAQWYESHCRRPYSYLDGQWHDPETWHTQARRMVLDLLSYDPPAVPLDARIEDTEEKDGLATERVSWAQPFGPRTEAFVIRPAGKPGRDPGPRSPGGGRLPGVVALHDHGGFYYYGKEKIADIPDEPDVVRAFKAEGYGGASWANELARRGYVVLVPDVFLWGSRRLDPMSIPEEYAVRVLEETPGTREHIAAYNELVSGYESVIAKTLFLCGTTWPGIMAWEDRRALDYLLSRREIDPDRVGCGGLSGGGLRTIYLAGLDPRIGCAVCVGFMSTLDEMPAEVVRDHTWMFHVPHLAAQMDVPDVASLHGPNPLMVQYDTEDPLWTLNGQQRADARLRAVFEKMGDGARYRGVFYPGPHKFDLAMQEDAFDWFDRWLR